METPLISLSIAARPPTSQQAQALRRRFWDVESLPPFLLPQHRTVSGDCANLNADY